MSDNIIARLFGHSHIAGEFSSVIAKRRQIEEDADPLLKDRSSIFAALGMEPDPWQRELMECEERQIFLLASRQTGKSRTVANYALTEALLFPKSDVLIFSVTQRQSYEMLRKVKEAYYALRSGRVVKSRWQPRSLGSEIDTLKKRGIREEEETITDNALSMEFKNESRIICLPSKSENVVSYSAVALIIIDEAAKMPRDDLYLSVRPMLSISKGRLILLSTPFGKRGFFWEEYKRIKDAEALGAKHNWKLIESNVTQCSRIDQDFLEEEKLALGPAWFRQEYFVEFLDTMNSIFSYSDIHNAVSDEIEPLF